MSEEPQKATQTEDVTPQDQEKYLLKTRDEIVFTLTELTKKPDLVSGYFNKGKDSVITTVISVLSDRGLMLLEYGPDKEKNQQLLKLGRMSCVTKHNDIDIRFKLENLKSAKYHGQHVIAAPIPKDVMRMQRREYFRIHTPIINPLTCLLTDPLGHELELPLADISIGGLCLSDAQHELHVDAGTLFKDCTLIFPEKKGEIEVDLEVRSIFMQETGGIHQIQRIGCSFIELPNSKAMMIQRYINRLQMQQKNLNRD